MKRRNPTTTNIGNTHHLIVYDIGTTGNLLTTLTGSLNTNYILSSDRTWTITISGDVAGTMTLGFTIRADSSGSPSTVLGSGKFTFFVSVSGGA